MTDVHIVPLEICRTMKGTLLELQKEVMSLKTWTSSAFSYPEQATEMCRAWMSLTWTSGEASVLGSSEMT